MAEVEVVVGVVTDWFAGAVGDDAGAAADAVAGAAVLLGLETCEATIYDNQACRSPPSSFGAVAVAVGSRSRAICRRQTLGAAKWGGELIASTKGGNVHCYPEVALHWSHMDSRTCVVVQPWKALGSNHSPVGRRVAPIERILPSVAPSSMEHLPWEPW